MAASEAEVHERREDDRAYAARQVEAQKVKATSEQTAELRKLREVLEALLARLPEVESVG